MGILGSIINLAVDVVKIPVNVAINVAEIPIKVAKAVVGDESDEITKKDLSNGRSDVDA